MSSPIKLPDSELAAIVGTGRPLKAFRDLFNQSGVSASAIDDALLTSSFASTAATQALDAIVPSAEAIEANTLAIVGIKNIDLIAGTNIEGGGDLSGPDRTFSLSANISLTSVSATGTVTGTNITTNTNNITTLQNRILTAGTNLNGGGNLTANRTFNLDSTITLTTVNANSINSVNVTATDNIRGTTPLSASSGNLLLTHNSHANKVINATSSANRTHTVTNNSGAWKSGDMVIINRMGAGTLTIAVEAAAGYILRIASGKVARARERYSPVCIIATSPTVFLLTGDLEDA